MKNTSKMHVRRGDRVMVIAGAYKGAEGQIIRSIPRKGQVVVEGVNVRVHHKRPTAKRTGEVIEGGRIEYEAPIQASNVMLLCPHCEEPSRTSTRRDADGTVERMCKRCDNPIQTA